MTKPLALAAFLLVALGGGLAIGWTNPPGPWYDALEKPWFNPPAFVFGPVWTIAYILIGVAGWRVFVGRNRPALLAWALQMVLNFAWTPVFFTAHDLLAALVIAGALLAAILAFLAQTRHRDAVAFWCFVPYGLWVAFATLLTGSLLWLNG